MNLYPYILSLLQAERRIAEYFIKIAEYYKTEPGIYYGCQEMASLSKDHEMEIMRFIQRKGTVSVEPLESMIINHQPGKDLSTDLRFLWLLTMETVLFNNLLVRALDGSENDLGILCGNFEADTEEQAEWLSYRLTTAMQEADASA